MCTEVVDSGLQVEALVAHTSTRLEEKGILETTENKIIIKWAKEMNWNELKYS